MDIPDRSYFIFGPRGTGKTTWLRTRLPEAIFVDLLRPDTHREFQARPERLSEVVQGAPDKKAVVIDEIQRAPELLHAVHDLMERDPGRIYVMTGSSARKLRRGGVNLLAGRALEIHLHPFMAAELPGFRLDRALQIGLIPLVLAADDPREVLRAYASLYLEQEIRAEGFVRNIGGFARFLEAVSFSHASVLNMSNIARECQVKQKTVASYLEVLEDLLLSFRVPVFTRRARRQVVAHPKLYLFDTGVFRSLRPRGPLDRAEEMEGPALEGLVAQHLRAWIGYERSGLELCYWRTRAGVEVDFVVYGADTFCAIEVKGTTHVRSEDVRSLIAFRKDYPECEVLLLHRGQERLRIRDVDCIPVEEFLIDLRPGHPLPAGGS